MKYKIGELEVEAIQWNGNKDILYNCKFLKDRGCEFFYRDCDHYKKRILLTFPWGEIVLAEGDFLVTSNESVFTLSERDFNKIATKVKEPKFKVGDKAYLKTVCQIEACEVTDIHDDHQLGVVYELDKEYKFREEDLFTLEEAIEKLKEL